MKIFILFALLGSVFASNEFEHELYRTKMLRQKLADQDLTYALKTNENNEKTLRTIRENALYSFDKHSALAAFESLERLMDHCDGNHKGNCGKITLEYKTEIRTNMPANMPERVTYKISEIGQCMVQQKEHIEEEKKFLDKKESVIREIMEKHGLSNLN